MSANEPIKARDYTHFYSKIEADMENRHWTPNTHFL